MTSIKSIAIIFRALRYKTQCQWNPQAWIFWRHDHIHKLFCLILSTLTSLIHLFCFLLLDCGNSVVDHGVIGREIFKTIFTIHLGLLAWISYIHIHIRVRIHIRIHIHIHYFTFFKFMLNNNLIPSYPIFFKLPISLYGQVVIKNSTSRPRNIHHILQIKYFSSFTSILNMKNS